MMENTLSLRTLNTKQRDPDISSPSSHVSITLRQSSVSKVVHTVLYYSSSKVFRPSNHCSDTPSSWQFTLNLHWEWQSHTFSGSRSLMFLGSRDLLPSHIQKTPNQGIWHTEVLVRRLLIRIVSQGLDCVHNGDIGSSWVFRAWQVSSPILTVPPYISFCLYHFPKRHMMGVHVHTLLYSS